MTRLPLLARGARAGAKATVAMSTVMLVSQKLGGMGRQPPERITEAATQGAATRGGFRLSGSCPERTATDEAARSPWPPLMWFTAL